MSWWGLIIFVGAASICCVLCVFIGWVLGRRFGENTARNVVLTELRIAGLEDEFAARLEQRQRAFAKATTRS